MAAFATACDEQTPPAVTSANAAGPTVRVASLVPAVTNMLLENGQGDKLVAVSNFDTDPRVAGLPRVGDLQTIDWEQIAAVRATHMVVQMNPARMPPGIAARAQELNVRFVNVPITTLSDVERALRDLEQAVAPDSDDPSWEQTFRRRLEDVRTSAQGRPPVATLIAFDTTLSFTAGHENYFNEVLQIAGGVNAVPAELPPYPKIDREALLSLRPRRVVLVLPNATAAQRAEAETFVRGLEPDWSAKWEDVLILTDPYAIVPAWSILTVVEQIAAHLHAPGASVGPESARNLASRTAKRP